MILQIIFFPLIVHNSQICILSSTWLLLEIRIYQRTKIPFRDNFQNLRWIYTTICKDTQNYSIHTVLTYFNISFISLWKKAFSGKLNCINVSRLRGNNWMIVLSAEGWLTRLISKSLISLIQSKYPSYKDQLNQTMSIIHSKCWHFTDVNVRFSLTTFHWDTLCFKML